MRRDDAERRNAAEEYLNASREHFEELQRLTEAEIRHYPLVYYLSGVCIECLFRAYAALVDASFDDKHDLRQLAVSGKFLEFMSSREMQQMRYQAAITDIYLRWSNGFRYNSKLGLKAV